jgi:hypothetical protein
MLMTAVRAIRGEARPEGGALARARSASSASSGRSVGPTKNRKFRSPRLPGFLGASVLPQKKSSFGERKSGGSQKKRQKNKKKLYLLYKKERSS